MILLKCYVSIPLLFLYNFVYDFIGVLMEIVGGMGYGISYGVWGMVLLLVWVVWVDSAAVTTFLLLMHTIGVFMHICFNDHS